jgi:hypothetical protein
MAGGPGRLEFGSAATKEVGPAISGVQGSSLLPAAQTQVPAALGFRVKSGWATAVLLSGPVGAPAVAERSLVALSDPAVPHSRQPYHADTGVAQTDSAVLARLIEVVHRCGRRSVAQLLDRHRAAGYGILGAGIVVGSDTPPESIANPHIRAHACEGRLFRTALEGGLQECGVTWIIVVERALYSTAVPLLSGSGASVKQAVTALGRGRFPGWRVDDKAATVAAWLVLASQAAHTAAGSG